VLFPVTIILTTDGLLGGFVMTLLVALALKIKISSVAGVREGVQLLGNAQFEVVPFQI
jgi:hypothetical protein